MKRNVIFHFFVTVLLSVLVFGCSRKERLYIYNWSYYTPQSIIDKFEEEFNVKIVLDEYDSNEDMFAKLLATNRRGIFRGLGRQYDIVFPSGDYIPIMIQHDMLERINHSSMRNLGNVCPVILEKATYDSTMEFSVPYFYGAAGIIVNTARVPDFQRSWSIFAREDLRDRMTMLDDLRETIGSALIFLGYSANSVNPAEITAARDLINRSWRPNLVRFDSAASGKGYANGDFWVIHGFPEIVFEEIEGNEQLIKDTYFFIPEEGGPAYIDNMVILKGARNIELAHQFIDFIHRPEIYAEFADAFDFPATANVPARELKKGSELYSVEDLLNTELVHYVGTALELYNDAWFRSIRIGNR